MAESYFKDPLLAKWIGTTSNAHLRHWDRDQSPGQLLVLIMSMTPGVALLSDAKKLAGLIDAELSGARRAREKIEEERMGCAEGDACSNCRALGRVLEAFDGE